MLVTKFNVTRQIYNEGTTKKLVYAKKCKFSPPSSESYVGSAHISLLKLISQESLVLLKEKATLANATFVLFDTFCSK